MTVVSLSRCRPPGHPREPARPRRAPTPTAGSRTPPTAAPGRGRRPRTSSPPRCSARCRGRERLAGRLAELVHAGAVGAAGLARRAAVLDPPRPGPGARGAAGPRGRTGPSGCSSTRWRSTRPAPRRWTPGGPTGRAAGWPTSVSTGGDEESSAAGHGRRHRRGRRRADRPLPLLPGRPGCPAATAFYYVRRLAPGPGPGRRGAVPPPGLAAPGRRPGRRRRARATARAATRPTTSACTSAGTAAGWSSRARRAPRRATTCGSPT